MFDSVRGRLALWHTLVLAALLVIFATLSYSMLGRAIARRTDAYLEESALALAADLRADSVHDASDSLAADGTLAEFNLRNTGFLVYDAAGRIVALNLPSDSITEEDPDGNLVDTALVRPALDARKLAGGPILTTLPDGEGGVRLYATRILVDHHALTVAAVISLDEQAALLAEARAGFVVAIVIGLLLAWGGGYALAKRSLAPVVTMSARAAEIGATSLHERLPVSNANDELGQLASTFNALLARLDTAFDQQRRFMADASHELRTPVAIMLGEADISLSRSHRDEDEYRAALQVVRDEGRRLSRVVADLFLLARADAGQRPLQRASLYLDEVVGDCVRGARVLASRRGTAITLVTPAGIGADDAADWPFDGDEELLRSLLMNLLDNAIKHSGPGAAIEVRLERDEGHYRISVADDGPGIPEEARGRVFERFYRADRARVREAGSASGGAGLGLAIGRWIAEAHGGSLELSRDTRAGARFEIMLPAPGSPRHESARELDAV